KGDLLFPWCWGGGYPPLFSGSESSTCRSEKSSLPQNGGFGPPAVPLPLPAEGAVPPSIFSRALNVLRSTGLDSVTVPTVMISSLDWPIFLDPSSAVYGSGAVTRHGTLFVKMSSSLSMSSGPVPFHPRRRSRS